MNSRLARIDPKHDVLDCPTGTSRVDSSQVWSWNQLIGWTWTLAIRPIGLQYAPTKVIIPPLFFCFPFSTLSSKTFVCIWDAFCGAFKMYLSIVKMGLIAFEFSYIHQEDSGVRSHYIKSRIGTNIVGSLKNPKFCIWALKSLKCTDIETKKRKEQREKIWCFQRRRMGVIWVWQAPQNKSSRPTD